VPIKPLIILAQKPEDAGLFFNMTDGGVECLHLSSDYQSDDSNEKAVSLRHGALSLIELLAAAAKENCNVMWK
jgi:hypothetical protein